MSINEIKPFATPAAAREFNRVYRFFNMLSYFKPVAGNPEGSGGVEVATVVRRQDRRGMTAIRITIDGDDMTLYLPAHDAINLASALQRSAQKIDPDYKG
jgi:hypothetical protein